MTKLVQDFSGLEQSCAKRGSLWGIYYWEACVMYGPMIKLVQNDSDYTGALEVGTTDWMLCSTQVQQSCSLGRECSHLVLGIIKARLWSNLRHWIPGLLFSCFEATGATEDLWLFTFCAQGRNTWQRYYNQTLNYIWCHIVRTMWYIYYIVVQTSKSSSLNLHSNFLGQLFSQEKQGMLFWNLQQLVWQRQPKDSAAVRHLGQSLS